MSKLSFSIALNMATSQFKKGADYVKSSLRQIQYQAIGMASALGLGGIGLGNLASRFINVARETEKAHVALKNVSGTVGVFAQNQRFLISLSKEYGMNLNSLTSEYAKFTASATAAGVSLDEQQKIYTSVTRSIKAFGLDSNEANLTFKAITQMMGKGKVSAEELRQQLGERIPIAVEAMARAVGGSVADLDAMMKKGAVSSAKYLGKFAEELDKMIPSIETDTLETSLTRIGNLFRDLGEKMKIGEHYKSMVDTFARMLQSMSDSLHIFVSAAIGLVTGKLLGGFLQYINKAKSEYLKMAAERNVILANQGVAEGAALRSTLARMEAEKALETEKARHKMLMNKVSYEDQKALLHKERMLRNAIAKEQRDITAATVAQQKAAAITSASLWGFTWTSFKLAAVRAIATVRSFLMTIAPMAIITGISIFVSKLIEARKEAKRIDDIFGSYKREMLFVGGGEESARLRALVDLMNDRAKSETERNNAQAALLGMLGLEKGSQEEINAAVLKRIELLKSAAQADLAARRYAEAEEKNKQLAQGRGLSVEQMTNLAGLRGSNEYYPAMGRAYRESGHKGKYSAGETDTDVKEFAQNLRIIADANEVLKQSVPPSTKTGGIGNSYEKDEELEKAEKKYVEELKKLVNQKQAGVIKEKEYNKSVDELNKSTYEEIGGILGERSDLNKTFLKAKEGVEKPLLPLSELADLTEQYNQSLKELDKKKELGLVSEKEYNTELSKLIDSTMDKITSFKNVGDAEREYVNSLKKTKELHRENKEAAEIEKYTTYLKEQGRLKERGIISEKEYQERLQEISKSTLNAIGVMDGISEEGLQFIEKLKLDSKPKEKSKYDGMNSEQLGKEQKKLNREIFDSVNSGVSDVTSLAKAFQSLNDVLEDTDASGLEKTLAVVDAIQGAISNVLGLIDGINEVKEALSALNEVQNAQKALDNAQAISQQTQNLSELGSTAATTAASVVAGSAATSAAKATEATANTAAAATGAASSVSSIPYVGPIMAVAAVASVLAALANLPKFEHSGIVGGGSFTGDKILARVNSGEMILNKNHQSYLFNGIKNRNLFGGSVNNATQKIRLELEGKTLVAAFNQEMKARSRI